MIKLGENLQRHQIVIVTVILAVDGGMAVFSVYRALADGRWPWVLMVAICLLVVLSGYVDLRAMRANLRKLLKRRNR
jgi:hypothetical protein